jgi:hypothetical protein
MTSSDVRKEDCTGTHLQILGRFRNESIDRNCPAPCLRPPLDTNPSRFVVEEIESAVQKAVSVGARLDEPIATHKWGRLALMADPFGKGFCFVQFLTEAMTKLWSNSGASNGVAHKQSRGRSRFAGTRLNLAVEGLLPRSGTNHLYWVGYCQSRQAAGAHEEKVVIRVWVTKDGQDRPLVAAHVDSETSLSPTRKLAP